MLKVLGFMSVLFLGAVSCKSVQRADVAGTWVMKDESRQVLPAELQQASAELVLNANGTFFASDMPGLFYFPNLRPARLESGSGVWKLESHGGKAVQLDFHQIAGWKKTDVPFGTQLFISKGWSTVTLYYSLGDPDEGRRVEFKRK